MKIIQMNPSYYCLAINYKNKEKIFLRPGIGENTSHLNIFETETVIKQWLENEQRMNILSKNEFMCKLYQRLYTKEISYQNLLELLEGEEQISSIAYMDGNGVHHLYYESEIEKNRDIFYQNTRQVYPKEPIYIITIKEENQNVCLLNKNSIYVASPEIAIPIFDQGALDWAYDMNADKTNELYQIEETNLEKIYMQAKLSGDETVHYILNRGNAPHLLLRYHDLKRIIEDKVVYQ